MFLSVEKILCGLLPQWSNAELSIGKEMARILAKYRDCFVLLSDKKFFYLNEEFMRGFTTTTKSCRAKQSPSRK